MKITRDLLILRSARGSATSTTLRTAAIPVDEGNMTWATVFTLVLCLSMLTFRYLISRRVQTAQRSDPRRWFKLARLLISAALALAAIGYTLQRSAVELGGEAGYEPSVVERIVTALTR